MNELNVKSRDGGDVNDNDTEIIVTDNNIATNISDNNNNNNNSDRKRRRNADDDNDINDMNNNDNNDNNNNDAGLFEMRLSHEQDIELAKTIFEIGLKHSSPKVLIALMPFYPNLNTEHIKSHLQKYRIHYNKSKDEFIQYYQNNIRNPYIDWVDSKGWEESNIMIRDKNSLSSTGTEVASDNDISSEIAHTNSDKLSSLHEKAENIINEYHKLFTSVINDNERIQSLLQISALSQRSDI